MARTARASRGGFCYHVLNRGNGRAKVFHDDGDYLAFTRMLAEARARRPMRILAYCLMPNHFHLVLWPFADGDLSRWMQWLMTTHVRRHHRKHGTGGHVWQGRFKAFPIAADSHLAAALRYVERNPVRAALVRRAEAWPWSSLPRRLGRARGIAVDAGPLALPRRWRALVRKKEAADALDRLRTSVNRGAPYGDAAWAEATASRLGIEASLRPLGRPRASGGRGRKPRRRRTTRSARR